MIVNNNTRSTLENDARSMIDDDTILNINNILTANHSRKLERKLLAELLPTNDRTYIDFFTLGEMTLLDENNLLPIIDKTNDKNSKNNYVISRSRVMGMCLAFGEYLERKYERTHVDPHRLHFTYVITTVMYLLAFNV